MYIVNHGSRVFQNVKCVESISCTTFVPQCHSASTPLDGAKVNLALGGTLILP